MKQGMIWSSLTKLPCWSSIHALNEKPIQVKDELFRLGRNCYFIAVSHDASLGASHVRRITMALWAESEGAALRATLMDIEADVVATGVAIPRQMLLPGAPITYGTIVDALVSASRNSWAESAAYRIARDGAFVHRVIHAHPFEFYFRCSQKSRLEVPYAILRRLQELPSA